MSVIVNQPQSHPGGLLVTPVEGHRGWTTGLFDCFSDCASCVMTYFCLPCSLCQIATKTGECPCMPFCVPGGQILMRTRIRTLGGIQGTACNDCLVLHCCGPCAVCQMQRELNNMGL